MASPVERWRLFFAFWPTNDIRRAISHVNQRVIAHSGRAVPDLNLHITLVFLGSVDKSMVNNLIAGAEKIKMNNLTLQLEKLQWWRSSRVVSLIPEIIPESLLELQVKLTDLAQSCKLTVDSRPYLPHLTLMRKVNTRPDLPAIDPIVWPLKRYCLVRSVTGQEGARYEIIWQSK